MLLICTLSRFIAIILISQVITKKITEEERLKFLRSCPLMHYDCFLAITDYSFEQRVEVFQYANISQIDYEQAYKTYIEATKNLKANEGINMELRTYDGLGKDQVDNKEYYTKYGSPLKHCNPGISKCLYFPIEQFSTEELENLTFTIEHATLRFLLQGDEYSSNLSIRIDQRIHEDELTYLYENVPIILVDPAKSRWLEYDITDVAKLWSIDKNRNLGIEMFFYNNDRIYYDRTISNATLNMFIRSKTNQSTAKLDRPKRSITEQTTPTDKNERVQCSIRNDTCCRKKVDVMFKKLMFIYKDIFDFVVYPKGYTGGICRGPCPLRYDFTHHRFLMQGVMKDKSKTTSKLECGPSRLGELMVLYYDQNDSSLLKVGYWKDVILLECDCQ